MSKVRNGRLRWVRSRWAALGLISGLLLLPSGSALAVEAMVRAAIKQADTYWTGQQLKLQLDLKSDGLSFGDQRFRIPQIEGALVLESSVATIKLNERVGGASWQVLRYEFPLFPQRAGRIEIDPIEVAFTVSQGYGSVPEPFELVTDRLSIEVTQPPSVAAGQAVLTSASASVEVKQTPAQGPFRVGDAVTRTVRRQVADISAMFLAPLPDQALDGVASYPKTPLITDRSDRGTLIGVREDRISYVFEQAGLVTLPGFSQLWWDPQRQRLRRLEVPPVTIEVAAVTSASSASSASTNRPWRVVGLALLAVGALAWLVRRRSKTRIEPDQAQKMFSKLLDACDRDDAKEAYNAYMAWRSPVMASNAPTALLQKLREAQQAMISDESWNGQALKAELLQYRSNTRQRRSEGRATQLQALNPS